MELQAVNMNAGMATSKYDMHRQHLEFMLLPDLVLSEGTGGGGARGGTFLKVDQARYSEVFTMWPRTCKAVLT